MEDEGADVVAEAPSFSSPAGAASSGGAADSSATSDKANVGPYKLPVPNTLEGVDCPGLLAQTGTLQWDTVGRSRKSASDLTPLDLMEPTILSSNSQLKGTKVAFVACSSSSCHSVAVTSEGAAYGWGRNECGQLGNGGTETVVAPMKLSGPWGVRTKIVSAAVGKYHTVLVDSKGNGWAAGRNFEGQLAINSVNREANITTFKQCKVAGENAEAKLVKVACGENFTVALDEFGFLYTAGNSEFGTLGNGETGEHFVTANKIAFDPCGKLTRRSTFVRRDFKFKDSDKPEVLPDSSSIRIQSIACGKFHTVAIEAARDGAPSRVFTWGCGNYGTLGHKVQKDEYFPRLVEILTGPVFASNMPVDAVCGSTCTIVRTSQGHGYYFGKHKVAGEATMHPTILDFMANNGHKISHLGAGNMHVVISTSEGQTVSYGMGGYGELGYGKDGARSSAQPKFIDSLNGIQVLDLACGYGHTAFILRDQGEEKTLLKKLPQFDAAEEGSDDEEVEEPQKKKKKQKKQ